MELKPEPTPSGFILPSIHSFHPFFTQQPSPDTWAHQSSLWTQLILSYARHRRLFALRAEDADALQGDWAEIMHNDRIKRSLPRPVLLSLIDILLASDRAIPDPPKQSPITSVLLCWRTLPEWASILHDWAVKSGQTNTILTFYEITHPAISSELSNLPEPLLRRAIAHLQKSGKAQVIDASDGGGVRFFL